MKESTEKLYAERPLRVLVFIQKNLDEEMPLEAFAAHQGLTFHGKHHEIYLSDPRRVPPDRIKTILRHPVCPAGSR